MECRLCLDSEPLTSIWGSPNSLVFRIWSCCELNVEMDDGLPDRICSVCETKLESFVEFKEVCKRSDEILRNRFIKNLNIKQEVMFPEFGDETNNDCLNFPNIKTISVQPEIIAMDTANENSNSYKYYCDTTKPDIIEQKPLQKELRMNCNFSNEGLIDNNFSE
ncbi:uncharacterized protein LOC143921124 isoform X2 [Arctopsyche grandis]